MLVIDTVRLLLFPAMMAFAASSDLLTMTISNRVSLILLAGFFVLAGLTGMPAETLGIHLGAALLVFAATFVMFACGWIGGGDAKLAAATALWLGFDQLLTYFVWASLFGGALTYLIIRFRALPLPSYLSRQEWAWRLHRLDAGVPYGIALAAAALMVYPESAWMTFASP